MKKWEKKQPTIEELEELDENKICEYCEIKDKCEIWQRKNSVLEGDLCERFLIETLKVTIKDLEVLVYKPVKNKKNKRF